MSVVHRHSGSYGMQGAFRIFMLCRRGSRCLCRGLLLLLVADEWRHCVFVKEPNWPPSLCPTGARRVVFVGCGVLGVGLFLVALYWFSS